jgi:hypothetical protein
MNERDAMTLLAEANPVRVEDLAPLDLPNLAHGQMPSRRFVLAIAVIGLASAASVIGVLVFGGTSSHPISAGPLQFSPLTLDFTRGSEGITSIGVTINAATLGGTALLQVVRGVPDSPQSVTSDQVAFQEQVPMTNIVSPPSGPPGTVILSTWSGTLSPSAWGGGCENTAYVIDVKVSPAVPTREAMGESVESGAFVCSSGS